MFERLPNFNIIFSCFFGGTWLIFYVWHFITYSSRHIFKLVLNFITVIAKYLWYRQKVSPACTAGNTNWGINIHVQYNSCSAPWWTYLSSFLYPLQKYQISHLHFYCFHQSSYWKHYCLSYFPFSIKEVLRWNGSVGQ